MTEKKRLFVKVPKTMIRFPKILNDFQAKKRALLITVTLCNMIILYLHTQLKDPVKLPIKPKFNTIPNCQTLIKGSLTELKHAKQYTTRMHRTAKSLEYFISATEDCDKFISNGHYKQAVTSEERNFSLAYSILVYKDLGQVERLLRAIYRPQNFYCIHVDKKADKLFKFAITELVNCFHNVFFSSKSVSVRWGTFSVLEADLLCMQDLSKYQWKYFINLSGHDFPLKTNYEIVKILKTVDGTNFVDAQTKPSARQKTELQNRLKEIKSPPHKIKPIKGSSHVVLSRAFVGFVLSDPKAKDFRSWARTAKIPDELFFSSLVFNPHLHAPGACDSAKTGKVSSVAKYKNIEKDDKTGHFKYPCHGKRLREVCVLGVGDLPEVTSRKELFATKFDEKIEPLALDCLENWLTSKTIAEYSGTLEFDATFYYNLDIVRNRI